MSTEEDEMVRAMEYEPRVAMAGALDDVHRTLEGGGGVVGPTTELSTVDVLGEGGGAGRERGLLALVVRFELDGLHGRAGVQVVGVTRVAFPTTETVSVLSQQAKRR